MFKIQFQTKGFFFFKFATTVQRDKAFFVDTKK